MVTNNLERKFFEEHLGWRWECRSREISGMPGHYSDQFGWHKPGRSGWYFEQDLPPIDKSWDAFQEWVVPEMVKHYKNAGDKWQGITYRLGHHLLNGPPKHFLKLILEELLP